MTLLVGYGTLLYQVSIGHSLGIEGVREKQFLPVLVNGYKRLFNLRATHYESSDRLSRDGLERAAMNVEPCHGARFNGVAFRVDQAELAILDQRECYYERRAAPVYHFATGQPVGEGQFYSSHPEASWIDRDPARLLPRWRDVLWSRRGAYDLGTAFGRTYDATTYLANGRDLVIDRYREILDGAAAGDAGEPG